CTSRCWSAAKYSPPAAGSFSTPFTTCRRERRWPISSQCLTRSARSTGRRSMSELTSRRRWLAAGAAGPILAGSAAEGAAPTGGHHSATEDISLNGRWQFRLDTDSASTGWREVSVPHTWQVEPKNAGYRGVAWYRRSFEAPEEWRDRTVRVE